VARARRLDLAPGRDRAVGGPLVDRAPDDLEFGQIGENRVALRLLDVGEHYTTKFSEYLTAGLPVVTGQIPLVYDLDAGLL
jgi:hypothetical protein